MVPDPPPSRAAELYLDYLARNLRGEPIDFGELCARHPQHASELRALHAGQAALGEVRARARLDADPRSSAMRALLDELRGRRGFTARFERGETIGKGGQGEVVLAHEKALRRSVAVKTLHRELLARLEREGSAEAEQMLARFLSEAQITAQLDHPGVAAVHELGVDDDGRPYFTMNRVSGMELGQVFDLSRSGDADWPLVRCVGLLQRVCETMAFAHSRGVVHRDLKPANVMVGAFGEVVVMDWGLARVVDAGATAGTADPVRTLRDTDGADRTGETAASGGTRDKESANARVSLLDTLPRENLGTVYYTPPEVAERGTEVAGPGADVYAVGAMLYELLAGHPPYRSDDAGAKPHEVLERIRGGAPAPLESSRGGATPAPLLSICRQAMARDTGERYANMAALAADLRAFLEERVVRAHGSGPWAELRMWVRRNRALAGALAAVLLLVAVGSLAIAALQASARRRLDLEADLYRLPYLERRAGELWPEVPATLPGLRAWLATGEALAARHALHARRLAALEHGGPPGGELARDALAGLVTGIERFAAPGGLLESMRARRAEAEGVERRTLLEPRAAWERAREYAADAAGPYGGMELTPLLGLVPLGPDPDSGLLEFGHPRSGRVPERARRDAGTPGEPESLDIDGRTSLVFVLVPGGSAWLGAQSGDPSAPGHDPLARPEEAPVERADLEPFLISKYELTQGQWQRLTGERPSFVRGDEAEGAPEAAHPVEGVSFAECVLWLPRFSMALPSEHQWEYAARAGTTAPFLEHARPESAGAAFNLADRTVLAAGLDWPQARGMDWLDDGFVRHAPVGVFPPNPFGLHDVIGNVWEWCTAGRGPARDASLTGAEGATGRDARSGVARGGGFLNNAAYARVSIRDLGRSESFDSAYHGLRPVFDPARGD